MRLNILAAMAATALLAGCHIDVDDGDWDDDYGTGLVVNGVTWAACNVAQPGRFAAHPEDYGNYYDFVPAQNACPAGWRTPTQDEWATLFSLENHRTTRNGINGRVFMAGERFIFLPMGGNVLNGELVYTGERGCYWTSTTSLRYEEPNAYAAHIDYGRPVVDDGYLYGNGYSVRCVKKTYYQ